jgi:hypothetical protein
MIHNRGKTAAMPPLVSLEENPRLYLLNRSDRLNRMCRLNAPAVVLCAEVRLINQANEVLINLEKPGLAAAFAAQGYLTEPVLRAEYARCMDLLADIPGDTLEVRLNRMLVILSDM